MIVILNGSPIEDGNSAFICNSAKEIIKSSEEEAEVIYVTELLRTMDMPFCTACTTPCAMICEQKYPKLKEALDLLRNCKGVIVISPVYFGTVTGEIKAFWDLTRHLRNEKALYNKAAGAVAIGASRFGGQETTIRTIHDMMLIQGMTIVGGSFEDGMGHYGASFQKPAKSDEEGIKSLIKLCKRVCSVGGKLTESGGE